MMFLSKINYYALSDFYYVHLFLGYSLLNRVYKIAFDTAMRIFEITKTFPKEEKYFYPVKYMMMSISGVYLLYLDHMTRSII